MDKQLAQHRTQEQGIRIAASGPLNYEFAMYRHEHEYNLFGRSKDRDRKVAWLADKICPTCTRAAEAQRRMEAAEAGKLVSDELGAPGAHRLREATCLGGADPRAGGPFLLVLSHVYPFHPAKGCSQRLQQKGETSTDRWRGNPLRELEVRAAVAEVK